jgi:hypothetical protein
MACAPRWPRIGHATVPHQTALGVEAGFLVATSISNPREGPSVSGPVRLGCRWALRSQCWCHGLQACDLILLYSTHLISFPAFFSKLGEQVQNSIPLLDGPLAVCSARLAEAPTPSPELLSTQTTSSPSDRLVTSSNNALERILCKVKGVPWPLCSGTSSAIAAGTRGARYPPGWKRRRTPR